MNRLTKAFQWGVFLGLLLTECLAAQGFEGGNLRYWDNGATFALENNHPVWSSDRFPVRAIHIRGEIPATGTFWSQIETAPGGPGHGPTYDFTTWIQAANYAKQYDLPLLVRFYPHLSQNHSSLLPAWVPRVSGCPGVSDMRRPDTRQAIRSLLTSLRDRLDQTGAKWFLEAPYAGWSGEPREGALRACFSASEIADMTLWAEDVALELVGPRRFIGNMDRSVSRTAELVEMGVGAFRQDGFMSWAKEAEYEAFLAHPVARQIYDRVIIFEQWGGGFSALNYEPAVHKRPETLLRLATDRYNASIIGFMGWPVNTCAHPPSKPLKWPCSVVANVAMVEAMHDRMADYAPNRLSTWMLEAGYSSSQPPPPNEAKTVTVVSGGFSAVAVSLADTTIWRSEADFPWIGDSSAVFPIAGLNVFAKSNCTGSSIASVVPSSSQVNPSPFPVDAGEIHVMTGHEAVEVAFACVDITPPDDDLTERVDVLEATVEALQASVEAIELALQGIGVTIGELLERQDADDEKHRQQSEIWREE